jgi:CCR4-NOT transcription complex subunit 1
MALILSALLYEWHAQERNMEPEAVYELSHTMASFLHVIRPELLPEFAFGWLELASHRFLFPNLLSNRKGENDGWEMVRILVLDAIRFFSSLLSSGNINTGSISATSTISNTVKVYYRGVMCWALLLLHDYSEFISYYAFDFISEIPIFCVQLKNLLLSAFPPHLKLMDPFSPNLNIDQLPESEQDPVMSDLAWTDAEWWKQFLGTGASTLQGWRQQWKGMEKHIPERSTSDKSWKRGLMRWAAWLVWYIAKERKEAMTSFFVFLTVDVLMEDERYYLYQSMANHLRYPNAHTAYYHHMLLYLFRTAPEQSTIREQVTRVLLERLTVNRPHPWGLLVTFIELIRNPVYDFWSHGFTHSSPDMERLFESVARSCMIRRGAIEDGSIVR